MLEKKRWAQTFAFHHFLGIHAILYLPVIVIKRLVQSQILTKLGAALVRVQLRPHEKMSALAISDAGLGFRGKQHLLYPPVSWSDHMASHSCK